MNTQYPNQSNWICLCPRSRWGLVWGDHSCQACSSCGQETVCTFMHLSRQIWI